MWTRNLLLLLIFSIHGYRCVPANPPANLDNCHPSITSLDNVYLVGYGSLLNTQSKNGTDPTTGVNIPVNVTGFVRRWNGRGVRKGPSTTYLGVDEGPSKKSVVNGVVFKLASIDALKNFDRRERFYCRKEVDVSDIKFLVDENFNAEVKKDFPKPGAQFWIYVLQDRYKAWPNDKYPIVQSYVDIFLSGCIEMEETYNLNYYKDNCITLTEGWNYSWVNDRLLPRRPWVHSPKSFHIDILIDTHLPGTLENTGIDSEIKVHKSSAGVKGSTLWFMITGLWISGWIWGIF